jgi:hypothetical protein
MNELDILLESPAELARMLIYLPAPERRPALLAIRRLRPDLQVHEAANNRFELIPVKPNEKGLYDWAITGDLGPAA